MDHLDNFWLTSHINKRILYSELKNSFHWPLLHLQRGGFSLPDLKAWIFDLVPRLHLQVSSTHRCAPQVSSTTLLPLTPSVLIPSFTFLAFFSSRLQPRNEQHPVPSSYCSIITAITYWAVTMYQTACQILYMHYLFRSSCALYARIIFVSTFHMRKLKPWEIKTICPRSQS